MSARTDALLAQLTLDEKAALTAGSAMWHTVPIPRLAIPPMKVSDGPIGVRGAGTEALSGGRGGVHSACFPNATCLAASFDPDLIEAVGAALGEEAKSKSVHLVLGPTVNLHRSPLGGRHFECYSEDPYLTARMAIGFVRGVQSQGVGTSVKHFVCNDSEFERMTISSEVSERALREIYLQPFEAAVREATPTSIMSAYNGINGTSATEHRELQVDILKREWGFKGLVVSDWFAVRDTAGAAIGGTDLEMPGPARHFGEPLAKAVREGAVPEAELDDKVRRILEVMEWTGALDAGEEPPERADDRPEHRTLARRAAAAGCVLLKNDGDLLPLRAERGKIALIGPNAARTSVLGGGSARVSPHYEVSVLEAFTTRSAADGFELVHEPGCTSFKLVPPIEPSAVERADGGPGFDVEYFASADASGPAVARSTMEAVNHTWSGPPAAGVDLRRFSARFRATLMPEATAPHLFSLECAGISRLLIDGELVIDNWTKPVRGDSWFGFGTREERQEVLLEAGKRVELVIEYSAGEARGFRGIRLGFLPAVSGDLMERAEAAAADAERAVVVVGLSAEWETEGNDKTDMELPGRQAELIRRVAAANPETVVVLNAGAPLAMEWAEDVPAVLYAWYGGQEAGNGIADVLFGHTDPGGRLPTTIPLRLEDVPSHTGDPSTYPGEQGRVQYQEDLWVGHRHYDAHGVAPRFAFGHGLSYARFEIEALRVPETVDGEAPIRVEVELRNLSERSGSEVVQLYLSHRAPRLPRPERELAAFAKATLAPGETTTVSLEIAPRALAFWDPAESAFVLEPGTFEVHAGRSSADLRRSACFDLTRKGRLE
jgi:beta-glucosidase